MLQTQVKIPKSGLDVKPPSYFIAIEQPETQGSDQIIKIPSPIKRMIITISGNKSCIHSETKYVDVGMKKVREEKMMKDGKIHGIYKRWYDNGTLCEESLYANGQLNGKQYYYSVDGKLMHEFSYKNGLLDGPQIVYYSNGSIQSRKYYNNGIPIGQHTQYYENGTLKSLETYNRSDGLLNGTVRNWHPNGRLARDGTYINGKLHGMYFEYNELDHISKALYFEEGHITGISI